MKSNKQESAEEISKFCIYLGENKEWRITTDPRNFILSKKVKSKKYPDKEIYAEDGYYQNIAHLLEEVGQKELREKEIKSLAALKKEIKKLHEELEKYARVIIS